MAHFLILWLPSVFTVPSLVSSLWSCLFKLYYPCCVGGCVQVHKEVHQSLEIKKDALLYVEQLIVKMLAVLCSVQPQSVAAVEERVLKKIPHPIDVWAMRDARAAVAQPLRNKKVPRLALPVDKIHQTLVKVRHFYKSVFFIITHFQGLSREFIYTRDRHFFFSEGRIIFFTSQIFRGPQTFLKSKFITENLFKTNKYRY